MPPTEPRGFLHDHPEGYVVSRDRVGALDVARIGRRDPASDGTRVPDANSSGAAEDIRLMACALAVRVHERIDKALRRTEVPAAGRSLVREAWEDGVRWRMLGEIGAIRHAEAEAALRFAAAGIETLAIAHRGHPNQPDELMQLAYVRDVALPALNLGAIPEDDAEALRSLPPA